MQEPGKTRLISLGALAVIVSATAASLAAMYLAKPSIFMVWLIGYGFVGALLTGIFLARIEYGEWMKGVPWWDRMNEGYRPPITFPANPPRPKA